MSCAFFAIAPARHHTYSVRELAGWLSGDPVGIAESKCQDFLGIGNVSSVDSISLSGFSFLYYRK